MGVFDKYIVHWVHEQGTLAFPIKSMTRNEFGNVEIVDAFFKDALTLNEANAHKKDLEIRFPDREFMIIAVSQ